MPKPAVNAQVSTYDFTSFKVAHRDAVVAVLKEHARKWCFQAEQTEEGQQHFQGRLHLKVRRRLNGVIELFKGTALEGAHFSITSLACRQDDFYVTKPDTRLEGPWSDSDPAVFVPPELVNIALYPWQEEIVQLSLLYQPRTIHLIYDFEGGIGKSTLIDYMRINKLGRALPIMGYKEVMQVGYAIEAAAYLIDMPRALPKHELQQFWAAIETLKGGYAFDPRHTWKERWFPKPQVFVFTNVLPDLNLLSRDRWVIHVVKDRLLTLME
jgi:hypothetical protein